MGARVDTVGLTKEFDGREAVSDLTLSIPAGAFTVLLGPSGCGKTTTLQMVAGLEYITAGDILFDGSSVADVPPDKRDVAVVFQSYALYPHMTVAENMGFGLKVRRSARAEIKTRVTQAADLLGIGDLLGRRPATLSGGQRQRVALGRAIVRRPRVFLLDEPLSNVDAKLRAEMRTELRALQRELQATFIYVTHDQLEALTMADFIAVLHNGVLQDAAPPAEIYDRPATRFVAEFVGSPPMNILPATLHRSEDRRGVASLGPWTLPVELVFDDSTCAVGIRPEDLVIAGESQSAVSGTVKATELLGADQQILVDTDVGPLLFRTAREHRLQVGDRVTVQLREGGVPHVFGEPSGRRMEILGSPALGSQSSRQTPLSVSAETPLGSPREGEAS